MGGGQRPDLTPSAPPPPAGRELLDTTQDIIDEAIDDIEDVSDYIVDLLAPAAESAFSSPPLPQNETDTTALRSAFSGT